MFKSAHKRRPIVRSLTESDLSKFYLNEIHQNFLRIAL